MKKLSDFLKPTLAGKGLKKGAEGAEVCFYAKEWGKDLLDPISFSRGILKVSVSSSSAAQALVMEEEELIKVINTKIGHPLVKSIKVVNSGKS
ncbi:MAG: hypothetical protein BWY68_00016 [bacterium ADurb.Bin400]|nr:MAG: hypothetical protein BWY68_00016 [bacterium ADurb.Bin400]